MGSRVGDGARAPSADPPEQARTLRVLVAAQILSGAGLAAGITVGALLARDMLGSTSAAGVPAMLFTVGAAGSAMGIGRISHVRGRRIGLGLGYLAGAIGAAGVVLAAVLDSVPVLFVFLVIYGAGSAANLQARYAGADLAAPGRRARAVAIVLVATTVGAIVGPNLSKAMGDVASALGAPALAGPFILASVAYAGSAAVLWWMLKPDPLLLARERAANEPSPEGLGSAEGGAARRGSSVAMGAVVMVVAQMVMIAIMTMTPVHMALHGHGLGAAGFVIAVHVAAMYLPSPLSGWLVDRYGVRRVAALSGVVFLGSALTAALGSGDSLVAMSAALALLGLGWSLGLVSGTAMVTAAAPGATRATVQGNVDFLIALAGATGGAISGVVVAHASFAALAFGGGALALALVPFVAVRPRSIREKGGDSD